MAPSRLTDWNLLRSFVAVVETGSLSRAAMRLGVTQPSVSRHMRQLERLLGETLFDRRPTGLIPTARAQSLYQVAGGIEALVRRAEDNFDSSAERVAGTVRITTSEAFGVHVLPLWLTTLLTDEPELEIELRVSQSTENLIRRDADIAVRFVRPEQDGVIAKRVGQVRLGLYANRSYLARHGAPTSPADIGEHLMIGANSQPPTTIPSTIPIVNPMGELVSLVRRSRFRTDSVLARLAAVEVGMGIGPILENLADARPDLQRVLDGQVTFPPMDIWLCSHEDLRRSTRIRRVYNFLEEKLTASFGRDTT